MIRTISFMCLLFGVSTSMAATRTWTDRSGEHKIEAELVTVRNGQAYLENPDGEISKVSLAILSIADLQHIATMPEHASAVKQLLPTKTATVPLDGAPQGSMAIKTADRSGSIHQFRSDSWGYKGLAFSHDGNFLVALGSDNVTVMDLKASTKYAYKIDSNSRSAVTFSPDGNRLLAGAYDGSVLVWAFDHEGNLEPKNHFSIHKGEIKSITVSPDNQRVITTHANEHAILWDLNSGDVLARYKDFRFNSARGAVQFSRNGGHALISDGQITAAIDTASLQVLQWTSMSKGSGQFVACSPDASTVASSRTYDIHYLDVQTGTESAVSKGKEVLWCADFSPNGKLLLTGGSGYVRVWAVETGDLLEEFEMGDSGYVKFVTFAPDGVHFAAIGAPIGKLVEVFRLPSELIDP